LREIRASAVFTRKGGTLGRNDIVQRRHVRLMFAQLDPGGA